MKSYKLKKILVRIVITIFIAFLIELFGFNFSAVKALLGDSNNANVTYTLYDMDKINWDKQGNTFISKPDPILIIPEVNMYIKGLRIAPLANRPVDKGIVFYTDNNIPVFSESGMIIVDNPINDENLIAINKYVKSLRIDLGEESGLKLEIIKVTINPISFNLSISRIIAMVLIYLFSIFLFSLQRSPDYGI